MVTSETLHADEGFVNKLTRSKFSPDSPLPDTWALWVMFQQGKIGKEHWQACQTKTLEMNTVGDFWRLYNSIHQASDLNCADYSLFRRGITPAWEDPACKSGGRLIAKCCNPLDESWLNVQLALVGEHFSQIGHYICGAVYSARRGGMRISLWLRTSEDAIVQQARERFENCLAGDHQSHIVFECFSHSLNSTNNSINGAIQIP